MMKDYPRTLPNYRLRLINSFNHIHLAHMPQAHNRHAESLATLASKVDIPDDTIDVSIIYKTLQATAVDLIPIAIIDEQDWHDLIIQNIARPSSTIISRNLQDFIIVNNEPYYQGSCGIMAGSLSMVDAKGELQHVHYLSCKITIQAFTGAYKL